MTILSIGLATYDQFFLCTEYPQENDKIFSYDFLESGGGPCANAAYLLGMWGEKIHYLGHLKNDIYGQRIIDEFNEVNVHTECIVFDDEMVTPLSSVTVNNNNGSRTIVTRKLNTPPKLKSNQLDDINNLINLLNDNNEITTVLVDGHELELSIYVIEKLKNKKVIMDAGSLRESTLQLAKYTDYLVASEKFLLSFSKQQKFETKFEVQNALLELKKITKGMVFVTLGEKGCAYLENNKLIIEPAFECHAIDTTGAGDIFHGAFTYGIYYGWNTQKIVSFASLVSAISIEKSGVRNAMPDLVKVGKASLKFEKNLNNFLV